MLYGWNRPRAKRLARYFADKVSPPKKQAVADLVRSIHLNMPGYGSLVMFFGSEFYVRWAIIVGILVLSAFYLNGGCVLTDFELALNPEGEMIVDPVLALFGLPVTRETRVEATLGFINICLAGAFVVYALRFRIN